jgi:hypothetical protein
MGRPREICERRSPSQGIISWHSFTSSPSICLLPRQLSFMPFVGFGVVQLISIGSEGKSCSGVLLGLLDVMVHIGPQTAGTVTTSNPGFLELISSTPPWNYGNSGLCPRENNSEKDKCCVKSRRGARLLARATERRVDLTRLGR